MRGAQEYQPVENQHPEYEVDFSDRNKRHGGFQDVRNRSESTLNDTTNCNRCGKRKHSTHSKEFNGEKIETITRSSTDLTDASKKNRSSTLTQRRSFRFFRDWWLELVGCVFIIGAVLAIVATAYSYQGHPLPAWPHWISINSLVAIYIVVLKAAILLILAQGLSHLKWTWFTKSRPLNDLARYDNASRGPLGSMGLLWSLRGRDIVSSAGAFIVIAAVILDPMAQQIIRYKNCPQPVAGENSSLPRTNAYMETGLHLAAGISTIPITLQSAVNGGIFVPAASKVSPDCSSGNCTFANPYFTVGFTSHCDDVSDELVLTNITRTFNTTITNQNPANASELTQQVFSQNYTFLNTSLPSGLSTSYNINVYTMTSYMIMDFDSGNSTFEIILGPQTASPSSFGNLCEGSSLIQDQSMSNWNCRGYGAARCTLKPAIFKVASNITAGKLQENTTLQTTDFGFAGSAQSTVDVSCLTSEQKSVLTTLGYQLPQPNEPQWLPYNVSIYNDPYNGTLIYQAQLSNITEEAKKIVPPKCIYQLSLVSVSSLNTFLSSYLAGEIYPSGTEWEGTSSVAQQFYNSSGTNFASVDTLFTNLSHALTVYVREHGWSNNSAPALGQVWHTETCIRVRWPLLAFPATLALLTLVFFVVMVAETRRAQRRVGVHHDFKSSPLALLFHGLDDGVMRSLEKNNGVVVESNDVHVLGRQAKGMFVRLSPTEKGWRFVTTDHEEGDGDGKGS